MHCTLHSVVENNRKICGQFKIKILTKEILTVFFFSIFQLNLYNLYLFNGEKMKIELTSDIPVARPTFRLSLDEDLRLEA